MTEHMQVESELLTGTQALEAESILCIKDLRVSLKNNPSTEIIQGISLALSPGKILALVGESGSGKSITSLSIMRLLPNALKISSGEILFKQNNIFDYTELEMQSIRGKKIAMIFQDALTSLNPVQTVGEQISETLELHTRLKKQALKEKNRHTPVSLFLEGLRSATVIPPIRF